MFILMDENILLLKVLLMTVPPRSSPKVVEPIAVKNTELNSELFLAENT